MSKTMCDANNHPIEITVHGMHGWIQDRDDEEYIYDKDEGWILRSYFEKKHKTDYMIE